MQQRLGRLLHGRDRIRAPLADGFHGFAAVPELHLGSAQLLRCTAGSDAVCREYLPVLGAKRSDVRGPERRACPSSCEIWITFHPHAL